jgi:hypothetical protein
MTPADAIPPAQLVGKRVTFKEDADHADCWHARAGLRSGVVKRVAQSLAQKAEMIAGEGSEVPDDWADEYEDVPRVWVKADACANFPSGCEAAVEPCCLLTES